MREKNIKNNVYALLKEKPKYIILYMCVIVFILFVIILSTVKIKKMHTYSGMYSCKKTCEINVTFTLSDVRELTKESKVMIQDQEYPLKIVEFKEIEYLSETSSVLQNVVMEIPELPFYENQLIELHLLKKEQNFLKILWNTLKGGDNNDE